jgi:hypothetical protein
LSPLPPAQLSATRQGEGRPEVAASALPAAISAPAPSQAPPASAAPSPFDPRKGKVEWSVSAVRGAVGSSVRRALAPRAGAWAACFHDMLRRSGRAASGSGRLELRTDDTGRVVAASPAGFDGLPGVGQCVAESAYVTFPDVDTGDASASVDITFRVE